MILSPNTLSGLTLDLHQRRALYGTIYQMEEAK
jgi:hypothetical protein